MDLIRQVEALGLFAALGGVAAAQAPLCEWSPNCMERTGWVISNVGDFDHDGLDDVAVAFPARQELQEWSNGVELLSAGRAVLRCIGAWGSTSMRDGDRYWSADRCGESLAVLRRDESGFEVAVGAPGNGAPPTEGGAVDVRAVLRGSEHLQAWRSPVPGAEFGAALVALPDLDGDAVGEIVVGATGGAGAGRVLVYSGKTSELLASIEAPSDASLFGQTLALVDDCDGDSVADLVVGDPWWGSDSRGLVRLYSGRTFEPLRTWRGEHAGASLGRAFCADHDLDGDGVRDFVMGAPGFGRLGPRGAVYVISPTSGRILLRIDGEPRDPEYRFLDTAQMRDPREFPRSHSFGWAVATGDFNGDGLADLAIGSPQAGPHHLVGKVYAISGVELRKHMAR